MVELYLATPSVVRRWARQQGLAIGERGPVSAELVGSCLTRPSAVRRWARERGLAVGRRGRIPENVLNAFVERSDGLMSPVAQG